MNSGRASACAVKDQPFEILGWHPMDKASIDAPSQWPGYADSPRPDKVSESGNRADTFANAPKSSCEFPTRHYGLLGISACFT
jgi:hypothetical protein